MSERPTCPRCGSRAVPVVYGEPPLEVFKAAERGEVIIAGCMVDLDNSPWECRNGHRFGGGA